MQRPQRADRFPKFIGGAHVAGVDEFAFARIQRVANRRDAVGNRQRGHGARAKPDGFTDVNRMQHDERVFTAWYLREVRPDKVVENVPFDRFECFGKAINGKWPASAGAHRVSDETDRTDVIEVTVRQEDAIYLAQLIDREITHARTGVNQRVVIEEEGRRAQPFADASATSEYAQSRCHALFRRESERPIPIGIWWVVA